MIVFVPFAIVRDGNNGTLKQSTVSTDSILIVSGSTTLILTCCSKDGGRVHLYWLQTIPSIDISLGYTAWNDFIFFLKCSLGGRGEEEGEALALSIVFNVYNSMRQKRVVRWGVGGGGGRVTNRRKETRKMKNSKKSLTTKADTKIK